MSEPCIHGVRGRVCDSCTVEELEAEIERLLADCKDKQRLIETQQQYLDNKDSVIKGMNEMISELEAEKYVIVSGDSLRKDNETLKADNERLRAANSELRHVLSSVSCEFESGTWQRRDIDAALKGDGS